MSVLETVSVSPQIWHQARLHIATVPSKDGLAPTVPSPHVPPSMETYVREMELVLALLHLDNLPNVTVQCLVIQEEIAGQLLVRHPINGNAQAMVSALLKWVNRLIVTVLSKDGPTVPVPPVLVQVKMNSNVLAMDTVSLQ